jgi:hypothetical protein
MAQGRGKGGHYAVCDCCDLEFPAGDAMTWTERKFGRRLKVLEAGPQPREGGPYREYWVEQQHTVCPTCHAELAAGGRFRAFHRNRSKMAVLAVAVVLAIMIATLPITLPHMMSALYMWPSRGR